MNEKKRWEKTDREEGKVGGERRQKERESKRETYHRNKGAVFSTIARQTGHFRAPIVEAKHLSAHALQSAWPHGTKLVSFFWSRQIWQLIISFSSANSFSSIRRLRSRISSSIFSSSAMLEIEEIDCVLEVGPLFRSVTNSARSVSNFFEYCFSDSSCLFNVSFSRFTFAMSGLSIGRSTYQLMLRLRDTIVINVLKRLGNLFKYLNIIGVYSTVVCNLKKKRFYLRWNFYTCNSH